MLKNIEDEASLQLGKRRFEKTGAIFKNYTLTFNSKCPKSFDKVQYIKKIK